MHREWHCGYNNSKVAGHGSPSTTKQYYIDVLNDFEKEQGTKLNDIYT